jgi:hypothetical protein
VSILGRRWSKELKASILKGRKEAVKGVESRHTWQEVSKESKASVFGRRRSKESKASILIVVVATFKGKERVLGYRASPSCFTIMLREVGLAFRKGENDQPMLFQVNAYLPVLHQRVFAVGMEERVGVME